MSFDPKHYFRIESAELTEALESALLAYSGDHAALAELFRLAHTLKGAARVVHEEVVAELAHALEDVLARHREARTALSSDEVKALLEVLDAIRAALAAAERGEDARDEGPEDRGARREDEGPARRLDLDTLRIELHEMDALAAGVFEAEGHAGALRAAVSELSLVRHDLSALLDELTVDRRVELPPRARASLDELAARVVEQQRALASASDAISIELKGLSARASALRLVDVAALFPELERAVFDAASVTGRAARFVTRGEQIKIDGHVLAQLRAALVHLVRNAVAHGIEDPDVRYRAGKPATGTVELVVERRGGRVAFIVQDDGQGIDEDAVRARAAAHGMDEGLETASIIFQAGISTAADLSVLAGRGVGLDIVRSAVERCSGTVQVASRRFEGSTFELIVPVSLSAIRALSVQAAGRTILVPLDALESTCRLDGPDLIWAEGGRAILHEDEVVPFHALSLLLEAPTTQRPRIALIVRLGARRAALGVDALAGTRDIIVRPLPSVLGRAPLIAGVAFDAEGDPQLVLDPSELIEAKARALAGADEAPTRRRPILVIDDSLTTRMLEQSILEGAGYEVELASSAEEALELASARPYGLFVVDVEMPGMNGYDFTREAKSRAALKDIPVIMVTSLASPESRQRGAEAGVSAYIVKGDFDQGRFLRSVEALLT